MADTAPDGKRADRRGRGPRRPPAAARRRGLRAPRCDFLDAATSASALLVDAPRPGPGPAGTFSVPLRGRRQGARERRVEQLQRRQPAGQLEVLGGGQLQRGGDAPGPVERARQERARARCERASRSASRAAPEAARAGQLHVDDVAGLEPRRRGARRRAEPTDSSAAIGVDTRPRTWRSSSRLRQGCSTNSRSYALERPDLRRPPRPTDQARLASTRSAGQGPTASRTAATRSASSGRPTFTLKHA